MTEKKITKAQQIRNHFAANPGKSISDVARDMGLRYQVVYVVKRAMDKKLTKLAASLKKPRVHKPKEWVLAQVTTSDTPMPVSMEPSALDVQVGGGHYKNMKIQPVEFITANNLDFLTGCIIKRVCRWKEKDGLKDLEKIKHEVDLLIELNGLRNTQN